MLFGNVAHFGVEIGECIRSLEHSTIYVQFRFWIAGTPVGDWEDRVDLSASIYFAEVWCNYEKNRRATPFDGRSSIAIFEEVYVSFFECDYATHAIEVPDRRERFHLDAVGCGAIQDKYGVIAVSLSEVEDLVVVQDLRSKSILDIHVPSNMVESVFKTYIEWGRLELSFITRSKVGPARSVD